jgi:Zn2+/Cd2+-exporting ATPase
MEPTIPHKQERKGARRSLDRNSERRKLVFAILCGVFMAGGWLADRLDDSEGTGALAIGLYLCSGFFGSYLIVGDALRNLLRGRLEIDLLMIVAAAGAAALGAWLEGSLLLFLFAIGHALEQYAMGRARRAIEALADLAPETATIRRNGELVEVDVESLRPGDIVVVRPNERIAADGFVISGTSSVDQSAITGESMPSDKVPVDDVLSAASHFRQLPAEHVVFAGTINQTGSIEFRVVNTGSQSTLARVVSLVSEAETRQSPTQRFTNRLERIYVPVVIGLVSLLIFAFLVIDEPASVSFYRAMAVLIGASPCALAISTPSAILSGVARAARSGVLIKGGAPLEILGRIDVIAFDKTGTLTTGKPRITEVVPFGGATEQDLLRCAVAVERLGDHPLAVAIVRDSAARLQGVSIPEASSVESITGRGIRAQVNGDLVTIGKKDLFADGAGGRMDRQLAEIVEQLEFAGRTTMIVRKGDSFLGVIGLMDVPRPSAREAIRRLKSLGVKKTLLLSGDNQRVADSVARDIGIDQAHGNLMPQDKVRFFRDLPAGTQVAMVGDGVNDAPAMVHATVGIAMGAGSSAVALETADMALIGDDISLLPFTMGLSRKTIQIIRQNVMISLGVVALLVPAAIFGLQLAWAVVFHEGSTVVVVLNALRLLFYSDHTSD